MLLWARAWPPCASGAQVSSAVLKSPAFQAASALARRRSAPKPTAPKRLPSHDIELLKLVHEALFVVQGTQVEVEGAFADAPDHRYRQPSERLGEAVDFFGIQGKREGRQQVDRQGARADLAAHWFNGDVRPAAQRAAHGRQEALGKRPDLQGRPRQRTYRGQTFDKA